MSQTLRAKFSLRLTLTLSLLFLFNLTLAAWGHAPQAHAADQASLLVTRSSNPAEAGDGLYLASSDGSGRVKIADGSFLSATWSPDGNHIAFNRLEGSYLMRADGSGLKQIINANSGGFIWSPDGTHLLLIKKSDDGSAVYSVVNSEGNDSREIASGFLGSVSWSPDSTNLIFLSRTDRPSFDDVPNYFKYTLNKINADGSSRQKLFEVNTFSIQYWVDGQSVVYNEVTPDNTNLSYASSIAVIRKLDASSKQNLISEPSAVGYAVVFSPDHQQVLISNFNRSKDWVTTVANPVGSLKALPNTQDVEEVGWSNKPGKILVSYRQDVLPSKEIGVPSTAMHRLEELDLGSGSRRVIFTTPRLGLFEGEGRNFYDLGINSAGLVIYTVDNLGGANDGLGIDYIVDSSNGKVVFSEESKGTGAAFSYSWRPNAAPTAYGKILPDFYNVWKQSDLPIAQGQSKKSWLWGPDAFATKTEPYKEAKGGQRQVQYFDKSRMEINNPDGDRSSAYFVTNGLLPKELIGGYLQTGDNQTQPKAPAEVNVAGDPGGSITYAKLRGVTTLGIGQNTAPDRTGQALTAVIDRAGNVTQGAAQPGVTMAQFVKETQHNLPNVFVDYFKTLPQDWVYVMGYPLSEAYQTDITLNGKPTRAVVQVFERRVLTYTPSNSDPYKVEQGNVGQHYYKWRYGG